jgi:hypothetical protein
VLCTLREFRLSAEQGMAAGQCRGFGSDPYAFGVEAPGSTVPAAGVSLRLAQVAVRADGAACERAARGATAMPAPHRTGPARHRRMPPLA